MLVTNKYEHDCDLQCVFFRGKLLNRGFPRERVQEIMDRYRWDLKDRILARRARVQKKIVPLKLTYSRHVQKLRVEECFKRHMWWLPKEWKDAFRCIVSFRSAMNLFRMRYDRFL